jgi:hypothetical protein
MAERKSFLLRIDARLYAELRRWASADLRSINGEIEFILKRWIDDRRGKSSPQS